MLRENHLVFIEGSQGQATLRLSRQPLHSGAANENRIRLCAGSFALLLDN